MYAVRGALLCARMGAYRASWFFFADLPPADSGVFSRSGLTTSVASGSVPKQSHRALAGLVSVLGASHFLGAVAEGRAGEGGAWVHTCVLFPSTMVPLCLLRREGLTHLTTVHALCFGALCQVRVARWRRQWRP